MNNSGMNYRQFAAARSRVAEILAELSGEFHKLEAEKRANSLLVTRGSLLEDVFRVLVLGEFSRGKSTLINALLGAQVLPAKIAPCTAVITAVRFGDSKRADLRFRDGSVEHIDLVAMPDELKRRITIIDQERNPIEFCDVYYPLPLLRDGVEIVDSPGLNESEVRTEITRGFFDMSDAIILVLNCEQAFSASERSFLELELRDRDLNDVFFLWNRFDAIRDSPEDREDIERLSAEKLEPRVGGRRRVFFVSARDGLKAKMQSHPSLLERSNLPPFENSLEEFLANERGRVKLRGPLRIAECAVEEGLGKLIPQRENLIRRPVEDLRRLFEQQKPGLEAVERQRERMLRMIDKREASIKREAVSMIRALVLDIEGTIVRLAGKIDIGTWEALVNHTGTKERVSQALSAQVAELTSDWDHREFRPTLEAAFADLETDLNDELGSILQSIDQLNVGFDPAQDEAQQTTALSRLVANSSTASSEFGGSLAVVSPVGSGGLLAGIGVAIATGVAVTVLHVPVLVIGGVLAALGLGGTFLGGQRRANEIRQAAIEQLSGGLRDKQGEMEFFTAARIATAVEVVRKKVQDRLAIRIDEVRGQVESVLRNKEQLESQATSQLEILQGCRVRMELLREQLSVVSKNLGTPN